MTMNRRAALPLLVVAVVALDQWTKQLARAVLPHAPREYAGGLLSLLYVENEGAFLSFGATLSHGMRTVIFTGAVGIAVVIALYVLATGRVKGADAIAVALIASGGIGNLIDRLMRDGRVTDFIYLAAGPVHTGVFNVADMAITGGVIWLLLSGILHKDIPPKDAS